MQTEELLVKLIFANQLIFCGIFGALGGVVHTLDLRTKINVWIIISKMIVSFSAGLLLFFVTYDISTFTPSLRIASSIVCGFYGSALFRYLAKFYMKQITQDISSKINTEPAECMLNKKASEKEKSGDDDEQKLV